MVAKKLLGGIRIEARIAALGGIPAPKEKPTPAPGQITGYEPWDTLIEEVIRANDSIGGVIECTCTNVPVGLGEPFFDSLESQLGHLAFSIPATRGIEFGDGFRASAMRGSQHNDCYVDREGHTLTNGAGGINGRHLERQPDRFPNCGQTDLQHQLRADQLQLRHRPNGDLPRQGTPRLLHRPALPGNRRVNRRHRVGRQPATHSIEKKNKKLTLTAYVAY